MNARRAYIALGILFAINMMNFFDRQILGAVGEKIKGEWALSDTALGGLGTAFTLLYAFVGLPLGRLSDIFKRKWILSGGVFLWSLMTGLSGVCATFPQLFAVRLGVGVGEASCAPASASLIGDFFPAHKRSNAMSIFMLGLPIGIALSFLVGGYVTKHYNWQRAFFIAAIPGILCAIASLFMHEPARGASETHDIGGAKREGSALGLVLSIPSMWPIIASGALHNFNMYAIGAFLAPLIIRYHKVDIQEAGNISMVVYGLSGIPGLILGGMLADVLTRRYASARMILSGIMFAFAAPLTFFALQQAPGEKMAFLVMMALGVMSMYVYYSTTYSTIQDLVEPSLRGMAMAIYFFAMYLLGASLGPIVMGILSDHFTEGAATAAGVAEITKESIKPYIGVGLHKAMYVIPVLNIILTFCMFAASATVGRDIEKVRAWMRDSAAKAGAKKAAPVAAAATTSE